MNADNDDALSIVRAGPKVMIAAQPTTGGVARHVADLARGLAERGCSVIVACPLDGELVRKLSEYGVRFVELPMQRSISPLADLKSFLRLKHLCELIEPEVLHVHSSKAGFIGRIAGKLAGVPVVVFTPHCWSFQSVEGRARNWYVRLERFASRFCDLTIAVSQFEADEALRLEVVAPDRIKVIHNGLSNDELAPAAEASREVPFVSVGRLEPQKGFTHLLDAMAELVQTEPDARLSIIGDGSLRTELRDRAAELGLSNVVQFEGEQVGVRNFLRGSHIFVLSSLWEGLPYTIMEAMAAGLPVISTNVGGCPEIVVDHVTGLLVPPGDSHALATAMRTLWTNQAERARYGFQGARRVRSEFRLSQCVEESEQAYVELLGDRAPSRPAERRSTIFGRRTAVVVVIIAVLFLSAVGLDQVAYRDRILPGVRVGGTTVGGQSPNQAASQLASLASIPVTVSVTGSSQPAPIAGSSISLDTGLALNQAFLIGRVGNLPQRLKERWDAWQGLISVPIVAADTGPVADVLVGANAELDLPPSDAHYEIAGGAVTIADALAGRRADAKGFLTALGTAATSPSGRGRSIVVPVTTIPPSVSKEAATRLLPQAAKWAAQPVAGTTQGERLTLSRDQIASLLVVEDGTLAISPSAMDEALRSAGLKRVDPQNARFDVKNGKPVIVDGMPGSGPDAAASATSLQSALESGSKQFAVVYSSKAPNVTGKDLAALGITNKLSTFTTQFRLGMDARDSNIALAAQAVQGKILGTGEVFSLNKATGPRNRGTGYQEALIFSHGKVVPGVGGGVCQVSSTLYEAALFAGLGIVERQGHSMAVSYLPPGRDATTFYPTVDLKFRNTTSGPLLLWSEVRGNELTMSIYGGGQPQNIQVRTVVKQTVRPATRIVYDSRLPHNVREVDVVGRPGYVVTSYRLTYQGRELANREMLSTDVYQPENWVIRVGT